jgi:predicted kinase
VTGDAPRPTLVVVSGPPASGKTTLAQALAREIGCPAICRDEIKEGMVHAAGRGFQGGHGDPLTARTFPLFFDVIRMLVTAGVTVVAEAAFQDPRWRSGLEPLSGLARLRIVRCRVDAATAFVRATSRAATRARHAQAHGDSTAGKAPADWATAFDSFEHPSLRAPAIDGATTDGCAPALADIVASVDRAERSTRGADRGLDAAGS